jgi:hypothetical protein
MVKKKAIFPLQRLLIVLIVVLLIVAGTALFFRNVDQHQPALTTQVSPTTQMSQATLTQVEEQQILAESEKIVKGWKVENLEFNVEIKKHEDNVVRVLATPLNQTLDPLTIIFEKKDGQWQYRDMGTAFPDLEEKIPTLFTE